MRQSQLLPFISQPSTVSCSLRFDRFRLLFASVISRIPALAGRFKISLALEKVVVRRAARPNNKLDSSFHPQHKSAVRILSASGYLCGEHRQLTSSMCESCRAGSVKYVAGCMQQFRMHILPF